MQSEKARPIAETSDTPDALDAASELANPWRVHLR